MLGHDLWSFDESDGLEIWTPSYPDGSGPGIVVTFTPDGRYLLVANEGEPNSYGQTNSIDPEGSISIIELDGLSPTASSLRMTVSTAGFTAFNSQADSLRVAGVRIFGPGATVAQDLEPEYITISADSRTAYVTLQENNAIAIVDIATKTVTAIRALGTKDHSLAGMGLDVSNEDGTLNSNSGTATVLVAATNNFTINAGSDVSAKQLVRMIGDEIDARARRKR